MAAVSRVDVMASRAAPVISASSGSRSAIVDAGASDGSPSRVCAAVSVSAVDIQDSGGVRSTTAVTSHPASSGDVHIVPIVHITNTAASVSDASSIGNSSMVMPPAVVTDGDVSSASTLPTTRTDHPPTPAAPVEVKKPRRDPRRRPPRPAPPVPTSHQTADLPDILHSHLPPPYCTLEPPSRPPRDAPPAPPYLMTSPGDSPPRQIPPVPASRSPLRNSHCLPEEYNLIGVSSRRLPYRTEEEDGKSCCGLLVSQAVSIRWFIIMIAFVGLCCAVVGTVLGALKATGREHLTVSLLMIGVGIVLITVSGIAWRLTSRDSPPCRVMLGLARDEEDDVIHARRFSQRIVPGYGRPHHPYAAMVYPEFQFRPPPPSYHASMQAYRLGLLLDRHGGPPAGISAGAAALSPPPLYRSHIQLRPMVNTLSRDSERSQPPSYHSRQSSVNPPGSGAASGGVHHHLPIASASHQQSMASHLAAAVAEAQSRHSRNPSVLSFLSHESLTYPPAPQHTLDHPAALVYPPQQHSLDHSMDDASDSSPTAVPPCGRVSGNSKRRNKSQKRAGKQRSPVVTSGQDGPVKGQSGGDAAGDLVTIVTTDGQLAQDVSVVTVNAGRPSADESVVVAQLGDSSSAQRSPAGEVQILAHL